MAGKKEMIPIEVQLQELAKLGIMPSVSDFVPWLEGEFGRAAVESEPYALILSALGAEREENGEWLPLSNDIYSFDTEYIDDDKSYPKIFKSLARISKGDFEISEVTSRVDHAQERASVAFTFAGERYEWETEYNGDWFDGELLLRINELLSKNGSEREFYVAMPDQSMCIVCERREIVERINILSPMNFLATTSVQSEKPKSAVSAQKKPKKTKNDAKTTKNERTKSKGKKLDGKYALACMYGGAGLLLLGGLYRFLSGNKASETVLYGLLGIGIAVFLCALLPIFEPLQHKQKAGKNAQPSLSEAELAAALAVLAPTVAPYIGLELSRRETGIYESKFGGAPYLPQGFEYPYARDYRGVEKPLRLLCQLNFAELPRLPDFPSEGILQFYIMDERIEVGSSVYGLDFSNPRKQDLWRVVYHREIEQDEQRLQAPPSFAQEENSEFPIFGEFALIPKAGTMPLCFSDYRWDEFEEDVWGQSEIGRALNEKYAHNTRFLLAEKLDKNMHKIGGYANFAQEDPRAQRDSHHSVLLLQIGSEYGDTCDTMWGDGGYANFFITPEALKNLDFSDVMYNWDCY